MWWMNAKQWTSEHWQAKKHKQMKSGGGGVRWDKKWKENSTKLSFAMIEIRRWWCIACNFLHSSSLLPSLVRCVRVFFLPSLNSSTIWSLVKANDSVRWLLRCLCKSHFKSHFCRNISLSLFLVNDKHRIQ